MRSAILDKTQKHMWFNCAGSVCVRGCRIIRWRFPISHLLLFLISIAKQDAVRTGALRPHRRRTEMKRRIFTGVGTALVTPMNERGVDYESFARIINWQIEFGILRVF